MIITALASTVRSAAKRAGYDKAIVIRTGRAAEEAELSYVEADECSVRIAVESAGVREWLDAAAEKYGAR